MNIVTDGIHQVADALLVKMRATKESHQLWVAPSGMVTLASTRKSWRRTLPPPDADLVGLYTPHTTCKAIREDLAERLREIQP